MDLRTDKNHSDLRRFLVFEGVVLISAHTLLVVLSLRSSEIDGPSKVESHFIIQIW